jgi:hypothetical protein
MQVCWRTAKPATAVIEDGVSQGGIWGLPGGREGFPQGVGGGGAKMGRQQRCWINYDPK